MAAMQTVCRCAMAWAPAAWTAARCSTLVARLLERGFARRECNGSEKSEVGSLRPTAEKNIMDGKHIAMVATPIVLLCVTAFLLRKSKPGREKARVSYTKRADGGRVAGRTVDKELWSRLIPAFAKLPISAAEVARLQDADDPHQVQVLNSRTLQPLPTVSTHGFELRTVPSKVTKWERSASNEAVARREAEGIVQQATGAVRTIAFDQTWRSSRRSNFDSSVGPGGRAANLSSAVARVHTDYTPSSALLKINELVDRGVVPAEVQDKSKYRLAIINVWRAFGAKASVQQFPLGCIRCGTVDPSDTFPYTLAYVGDMACGINGSIQHDPTHEWHFFDAMTPDEVLLFVNYEESTERGALPKQIYHAALELMGEGRPTCEAAERLSLEVRVLALLAR